MAIPLFIVVAAVALARPGHVPVQRCSLKDHRCRLARFLNAHRRFLLKHTSQNLRDFSCESPHALVAYGQPSPTTSDSCGTHEPSLKWSKRADMGETNNTGMPDKER